MLFFNFLRRKYAIIFTRKSLHHFLSTKLKHFISFHIYFFFIRSKSKRKTYDLSQRHYKVKENIIALLSLRSIFVFSLSLSIECNLCAIAILKMQHHITLAILSFCTNMGCNSLVNQFVHTKTKLFFYFSSFFFKESEVKYLYPYSLPLSHSLSFSRSFFLGK